MARCDCVYWLGMQPLLIRRGLCGGGGGDSKSEGKSLLFGLTVCPSSVKLISQEHPAGIL